MRYRELGNSGVRVSVIGLGGHEFGPGGKIRGFQDDPKLAIRRGYVFEGFGGANRREIVAKALDHGINLFDLTIDSEKEAMGRLLREIAPSQEILIQTRPEGMVYSYDPANRQMAQYDLLRAEVERICGLLKRDHVDILNFAFMKDALDADPDYMEKIGENIRRLKEEGLIRFAGADTFSGEATYLEQYRSGHFDVTFINYNPSDRMMEDAVIPEAAGRGMGILTRETFRKGRLFEMAAEAGIEDRGLVARCAVKWGLRDSRISAAVLGVATPEQLESNCEAAESPELTESEQGVLDAISSTEIFKQDSAGRRTSFKR